MSPLCRRTGLVARCTLAILLPRLVAASEMSLSMPAPVRDAGLAAMERIEGRAERGPERISYVLYVDPRYPAMYRLTHFRVVVVTRSPDGSEADGDVSETLVWNSRPGSTDPLLCYALQPAAAGEARWDPVPTGTDAYRAAMATSIFIYGDHARQFRGALR